MPKATQAKWDSHRDLPKGRMPVQEIPRKAPAKAKPMVDLVSLEEVIAEVDRLNQLGDIDAGMDLIRRAHQVTKDRRLDALNELSRIHIEMKALDTEEQSE